MLKKEKLYIHLGRVFYLYRKCTRPAAECKILKRKENHKGRILVTKWYETELDEDWVVVCVGYAKRVVGDGIDNKASEGDEEGERDEKETKATIWKRNPSGDHLYIFILMVVKINQFCTYLIQIRQM